ncbi:tyrosine-type recombinase/integrase [Meridianimarinicoccus sp. RP-17]|uniref:tyrosine-type recombinase/integrase n=1 Tax=Meridianimarinicoccus zhengii TaxID=2056810 RepID=UPI000DAD7205|nr:tyrosine-type recombinase/integrase [Phycocomes zhengii]
MRDYPGTYRKGSTWYFRYRGHYCGKLPGRKGSPEFVAAMRQHQARIDAGHTPKPQKRTIRKLITSYRKAELPKRAPRTQKDYLRVLEYLEAKAGDQPVTAVERRHVIAMRDAQSSVKFARDCIAVMSVLMEHAIDIGWRASGSNPAKGVKKPKTPDEDALNREPWPADMLTAYRAEAPLGTRERLVMELCIGTGQRIGDVLKMRWSDIEDGAIRVKQNKTKKRLLVPPTRLLTEALAATRRRSVFMLTNHKATGPWSYRGASAAIFKVREKIGAARGGMDIHAWRHNAASELWLLGCTVDEIGAITGMSPPMVRHYTATVTQIEAARRAQERRE